MKKIVSLAALSAGATLAGPLAAAEPCYLALKANGTAVDGEVTQKGREKTIECVSFENEVTVARDAATGMATGRRQYAPLKCIKRVDKSSPLLLKALVMNQTIDAQFKFFRASPMGAGVEEQFYTVAIKNARIASIKQHAPSSAVAETRPQPFVEEVTFTFQTIEVTTNGPGGTTTSDNTTTAR